MKYLKKVETILKSWGTIYTGCSAVQVDNVENAIGQKLPFCYREFLENFGYRMDRKDSESRGGFVGISVFYGNVYGGYTNKDGLLNQLLEDNREDLIRLIDENFFVFYSSQGIIFAFFYLNESDDPVVYGYIEGSEKKTFPKLANTLSEFFEGYLQGGTPLKNL